MKKLSMIVLATLFANFLYSQDFIWAKAMGGSNVQAPESAKSSSVDAAGNIYTTGAFGGTVDFDPGGGVFNMGCNGCQACCNPEDIFITKLDASGNFIWAKQIGGTGADGGNNIVVDNNSNLYITGTFQGTVDFDPGAGTFNLSATALNSGFVVKLNSAGNFIWAVKLNADGGAKIALNASNLFACGYAGTGAYVIKFDFNGNLIWEKKFVGANNSAAGIAVDGNGNVFSTGYFNGTTDFDPSAGISNLTASGFFDAFISKLDASGNFVWAKQIGGSGIDEGNNISINAAGNLVISGVFDGTADFDPGPDVVNLTSAGNSDIFICEMNTSGQLNWAKSFGGSSSDKVNSLVINSHGNILTAGTFLGTVDFDPGTGVYNLINPNGTTAGATFVSKLDPYGDFISAKLVGNSNGNNITIDPNASTAGVYVTGIFGANPDFDPGSGIYNIASVGGNDMYILKLTLNIAGDADDDGIPDASDNCPFNSNVAQRDFDGDAAGDACDTDDDNDGSLDVDDCAPLNPDVHPGATEICNNVDDNCNGQIDEGFRFYPDADNDGYGNPNTYVTECSGVAPAGYVSNGDDCYDQSPNVHPGAVEVCNGTDDDCDGLIDEGAGQPTITPSGTVTICSGNSILLTSSPGVTHQWYRNNKVMRGETSSTLLVTASGGYKVKVTFTECPEAFSAVTTVNVVNSPAATISYRGNTDICSSGSLDLKANKVNGATYQWNKDAVPISGATQQTFTATVSGSYTVTVSKNGCSSTSSPVVITNSCGSLRVKNSIQKEAIIVKDFGLYPNPSSGRFKVIINQQGLLTTNVNIQVIDRMGRTIITHVDKITNGTFNKEITMPAHVVNGIYLVRINTGDKLIVKKLVIAKND
jgi:hypothetical protein